VARQKRETVRQYTQREGRTNRKKGETLESLDHNNLLRKGGKKDPRMPVRLDIRGQKGGGKWKIASSVTTQGGVGGCKFWAPPLKKPKLGLNQERKKRKGSQGSEQNQH